MARQREEPMEPTTPTELRSFRMSVAYRDGLARRLLSCPACGVHWVADTAGGVEVVGVRSARFGDPSKAALVCELCLTCVDDNGSIVIASSAN